MATHAGPVKRRPKADDLQTDIAVTCKSKRARHEEPDRQGATVKCLQHRSFHLDDANQFSKDHSTGLSTSIHSLPPELMVMIFRQLDCGDKVRAACVCSHWHDLIDIPSVWRDFCPILNVDRLDPEHFPMIQTRKIRKVKIRICDDMEKMTRFLQASPHLKNLTFNIPCLLPGLCPGEDTFPGIEHLTMNLFYLKAGVLQSLLQPMVNLQDLRLDCVPDENIFCALKHSKHLVSISIKCSREGVKIAGTPMGDLNPVPSLKRLTLEKVTVGDSGLDFISTAFPQLYTLELMLSPDVTSDGLAKLAKLKELKNLKIRSGHFNYDWMKHLHIELSQLENLRLHECRSISNECIQSIAKMPVLRFLRVPIQDHEVEGLQALSKGCHGLHTLCLAYGNPSINQGLHVVKHMPCLQELTLENCSIDDDFWRENSKFFNNLRRLSFINCQLLSECCLPYLSQMACLERLSLIKCMTAPNESIGILGENGGFKALNSLVFIELGIKDGSFMEFSKDTPFLTKLEILSCSNVTENGLAAVVSSLPLLKALKANISVEAKRGLKNIRPHLHFYSG